MEKFDSSHTKRMLIYQIMNFRPSICIVQKFDAHRKFGFNDSVTKINITYQFTPLNAKSSQLLSIFDQLFVRVKIINFLETICANQFRIFLMCINLHGARSKRVVLHFNRFAHSAKDISADLYIEPYLDTVQAFDYV